MKKHLAIAAAFLTFTALPAGDAAVRENLTFKPENEDPAGWNGGRRSSCKSEPDRG